MLEKDVDVSNAKYNDGLKREAEQARIDSGEEIDTFRTYLLHRTCNTRDTVSKRMNSQQSKKLK